MLKYKIPNINNDIKRNNTLPELTYKFYIDFQLHYNKGKSKNEDISIDKQKSVPISKQI